jgi:MFS family permease
MTFEIDTTVAALGVSLFVLGFAVGPLLWAPASELYGRQLVFAISYGGFTAFIAGTAGAKDITTLLVLRFLAGSFGSSPLTNAGGVIADIFSASDRGLAMSLFALAPFLGPTIGPIAGGFLAESKGWRWVQGTMAIFVGVMWILGLVFVPETYGPVILRKRAAKLSSMTGKIYRTREDAVGRISTRSAIATSLVRPWILMLKEPIVVVLSVYMAIIYGTLYMLFGAFPIVFQLHRGWSEGIGGLAFLGVAVGMIIAVMLGPFANKRYMKLAAEHGGIAPPEARLDAAIVGAIAIPIGLFWFAWTNSPSIHWISPIAAGVPFGFGMVVIFLSIINYLIDSYTIFAASVLAANSVLRSLFGFAFPLFTTNMYQNLGIHWASCVPAFLALACVPAPLLLLKYGAQIRARCVYAAEAEAVMVRMRANREIAKEAPVGDIKDGNADEIASSRASTVDELPELKSSRTVASISAAEAAGYEVSSYDIDRVNTANSLSGLPK